MAVTKSILWRHVTAAALAVGVLVGPALTPVSADVYAKDKNSTDPNRATIEAFAKEVASIPALFGCNEFAWGKMTDPTSLTLEFVPPGADVNKWTRLVTITTIGLSKNPAEQITDMMRVDNIVRDHFGTNARAIIDSTGGTAKDGTATRLIEYEIGDGAATEHNAAGLMRVRPDLAAIVQIQSRGAPLPREDVAKLKNLISQGTKN